MTDMIETNDENIVTNRTLTQNEGEKKMKKSNRQQTKPNSTNVSYKEITLALTDIQKDEDRFRRRVKEDEKNIEKLIGLYKDNMEAEENGEPPPHEIELILVWYDPIRKCYFVIGGYHRITALRRLGITEFQVRVFNGSEDDAFAAASYDNAKHGKELKDGDKAYSVRKSFERYGDTKKHIEIAREVGCARSLVSKVYKDLFGKGKRQKQQEEAAKPNGTGKPQGNSGSGKPKNPTSDQKNDKVLPSIPEQANNVSKENQVQPKCFMEIVPVLAALDQTLDKTQTLMSLEQRGKVLHKVTLMLKRHRRYYNRDIATETNRVKQVAHENQASQSVSSSIEMATQSQQTTDQTKITHTA